MFLVGFFLAGYLGSFPSVKAQQLAEDQFEIANQFERLETLALRIADQAEEEEPERANQIRLTIRRAQTLGIEQRFKEVVALLEQNQLSRVNDGQQSLADQLEELYQLILADPRESQLEKQRKAWEQVEKEVRRLIRAQRSLRSRTKRSVSNQSADEQRKLAEQTEDLKVKEPLKGSRKKQSSNNTSPSQSQQGESQGGESQQSESQQSESQKGESQKGESQPGEGELGQPKQSNQSPAQSKPSTAERVTKQLERAEKAMREAEERLTEEENRKADKKQLEAQHELESAQREAQEMLRQLREEEKQRKLASLADRLRGMKKSETSLLKSTLSLDSSASKRSERSQTIEASKLAQKQTSIAATARRALQLIEEDGKSLAFAEAMRQTYTDMETVDQRLKVTKTNRLTQQIEQGIIDSLEEMLLAVEETLEEMQEQNKGKPGGQQQSGEAGLVAKIAELRLLRSSQVRLKRQTVQWQTAIGSGDATQKEANERFQKLANEQSRLAKAASYAANQDKP